MLQDELQTLFGLRAHIAKSKKHYLEITHPEANKGCALLHLAGKLGIDRSEIIGLGYNHNDFEFITINRASTILKTIGIYVIILNNLGINTWRYLF
jgi:hydroxymethylpyrimidine pyrophosphatase-like HAD family hydrolase